MLIRLLILSAFVLLVHLVVGMFARDLKPLQVHDVTKRAAKDDGSNLASSIMYRRRQLVTQQQPVKRAVSHKTGRRHRGDSEELLRAEETQYDAGALVKVGEGNATLSSNESDVNSVLPANVSSVTSDARDNVTVNTPTESKESSSSAIVRKRRPIHRVTEPPIALSHLPVAAALTMSDSLYNHFRPLESEVPEDQFLPFLQFGKKLVPNAKTTFPATVTSSTNTLDSVTNSPRVREYSSFHPPIEVVYPPPVTKPRPSEEEINEDMDVAIVKSVIEKNKAIRGKPNSLLNLRNVGGLYRKQLETNENLVFASDKSIINDTGVKINDTKDFERKRLSSIIAGKKEVIVDSNGRRKFVSVSRRPVLSNITSTAAIITTTPSTNLVTNTTKENLEIEDSTNRLSVTELTVTSTSTPSTTTSTTAQPTITSTATTVSAATTTTSTTPSTANSDRTVRPLPSSTSRTSIVTRAVSSSTANYSNMTSSTITSTSQPNITSTTTTTTTTTAPTTLVNDTNTEQHVMHDPTQFSSSNVVAARTIPQRQYTRNSTGLIPRRRTSPLYNTDRRTNPLRTAQRHNIDNTTDLDMIPEESNVSSSLSSNARNASLTENQTTNRQPSIIEKYQQMRMADVHGGRRYFRPNYTEILKSHKNVHSAESDSSIVHDSQSTFRNISDTSAATPSLNLSSSQISANERTQHFTTSSERPSSTSTTLIPTTKILSTAVVTSVSIKGAWTAGVTELPPQEVFPEPPHNDSPVLAPVQSDPNPKSSGNITDSTTDMSYNLTMVNPTAPGNETYSMIKDLLAGINTSKIWVDSQSEGASQTVRNISSTDQEITKTEENVRQALPLSHEHFVGVDSPRPVFSNSSVVYTTSYSRNESPQTDRVPPEQPSSTLTSLPVTTPPTTTIVSPVAYSTAVPPQPSSFLPSSTLTVTQDSQLTSSSSLPPLQNASVYQQYIPSVSDTEQNISKGRALWINTTSRPSTNIPVVQSSDKDFDLPLVKLYNTSTVWGDIVQPTEETSYNETQYEIGYVPPDNRTDFNETVINVHKCSISEGCSEDEAHVGSTHRPLIKDCDGSNSTREGCGSRPREGSVSVAESTSSIEMAIYVLAGISVIPAAVGALFLVRCVLRHRRKVLDESDTCSEISCHRAGENGEATTPASTKLPRLQPHMGWDQEKSPASPPTVPDANTRWEFPRSMLRLQTVLGQGNFGQVLKAEADDLTGHPGTTRLVAVKLVKEGATSREKEDLLRELEIMKELGAHPNVVTLLGCCTEQEPYLLIMEYVMYGKLLTFLRDHRTRQNYYNFSEDSDALTSRDLTVFGYCVARGMEYLVSKGIIHRDLAARNVLVDHNKLCKIADFGMSRTVRELGEIYEQRQTKGALPIRWMAPESLLYRVFTHKSDVWSFGILMWEIVTLGSTPYPTMGAREVMKRVREGYRLERPSHCRPELFRVISHCWHSDPAKRPDFSELKRELGTLVEDARQGKYVDLDRFAEYSGGRTTTQHSGGDPEHIHM